MKKYDLSPLYRSAIGFDRMANLLENAASGHNSDGYPPYNVELIEENRYRITMAVAGFTMDELEIESRENKLTVTGSKEAQKIERHYLYQGIGERNFERRFQLADHIKVTGACVENGLLHIDLEREIPEAMKPRKIEIKKG